MTVLAYLDFETTGLDTQNDEITEVAVMLKRFGSRKHDALFHRYVYSEDIELLNNVPEEITKLTGIDNYILRRNGQTPSEVARAMAQVLEDADCIVAHNGKGYDKPIYDSWCKRHDVYQVDKPWVDSASDIEWNYRYNNLSWLALEQGFLNPFPHDAMSDVQTLEKVFSNEIKTQQQLDELIEYSQIPDIIVIADVTYSTNKLAKDRKYRWNPENKTWWKLIKESEYKEECNEAGFTISQQES